MIFSDGSSSRPTGQFVEKDDFVIPTLWYGANDKFLRIHHCRTGVAGYVPFVMPIDAGTVRIFLPYDSHDARLQRLIIDEFLAKRTVSLSRTTGDTSWEGIFGDDDADEASPN